MYRRTSKDIDVSGCHASRRDMLAPCPQGCEVYVYTLPKGARPCAELYAGQVDALYELCTKWRLLLPELAQITKLLQSGTNHSLHSPQYLLAARGEWVCGRDCVQVRISFTHTHIRHLTHDTTPGVS